VARQRVDDVNRAANATTAGTVPAHTAGGNHGQMAMMVAEPASVAGCPGGGPPQLGRLTVAGGCRPNWATMSIAPAVPAPGWQQSGRPRRLVAMDGFRVAFGTSSIPGHAWSFTIENGQERTSQDN
jgi:hypothetical protein